MIALVLAVAMVAQEDTALLRRAVHLLQSEDVPAARALVDPMLAGERPGTMARLVGGMLRFREQRYDEAVKLFESVGTDATGVDDFSLARNARELTKDHVRAEGRHFTVSTPRGKDEVLVPYLLDALEAQRAALEHDLGWVPPERVTIEILESPRELAKMSTLTEEEIKTSGTIALCKYGKMMVVSPKALVKGYDWLDTAAHEYVHFVVARRGGEGVPIWLHEGIAKWAETRWRGKGGESLSPYSAALLKDAARRNELIPFERMHPSMAKLPSQEAAALAFAQVMVAVEYLAASAGPRALARVVEEVRGGKGAEEAVAGAASTTFPAFLAGWRRHIAERPMPTGGERELERLRFKGDPKHGGAHSELAEIPDEQARGWARLGEIFRERGRMAAARVEYERAIARAGGTNPALATSYAVTAIATGRESDAEKALREALRAHPQYAALHVNLGRIHVRRKEWPAARQALLLANRTDPFDPEIHAGLALAHDALGEAEAAARERRFAQLLSR